MSFRGVDNSNSTKSFFGKKLMIVIIIVLAAGLTFAVWFFFISDSNTAIENGDNFLPPPCYSINGKQICPKT